MMKIIKKQSKQTYLGKDKKEHHYYNYFLVVEGCKPIQVQPVFKDDRKVLDFVSIYEK